LKLKYHWWIDGSYAHCYAALPALNDVPRPSVLLSIRTYRASDFLETGKP